MTIKEVIDLAEVYAGIAGQDMGDTLNPKLKLRLAASLISELYGSNPIIDDVIDVKSDATTAEVALPLDVVAIDRVFFVDDSGNTSEVYRVDPSDEEALNA